MEQQAQVPKQQNDHANTSQTKLGKAWPITFAAIAFLGFLDAAYLTVEHYLGLVPPCTIVHGCATVTTSSYSVIAGVPIAFLGAVYYLIIFISAIFYLDLNRRESAIATNALGAASWFTILGFLTSMALVYLQFFVIHSICLYCMFSATVCTCLFLIGMYFLKKL